MKTLVFCVCVLACVSFISTNVANTAILRILVVRPEPATQAVDDCLNQVGLLRENAFEIEEIINDIPDQPGNEEKRRKHGCAIECLLKKLEWMEGSELIEGRIYGNITQLMVNHPVQNKVETLVHNCTQEVKSATQEKCEKGFTTLSCITKGLQGWGWGELIPTHVIEQISENEEHESSN